MSNTAKLKKANIAFKKGLAPNTIIRMATKKAEIEDDKDSTHAKSSCSAVSLRCK